MRVESKVKLLEMLVELLRLLWHLMVSVRGMIVVDAKINELVIHLINDLPACSLVLFLEILCIRSYFVIDTQKYE